jgi:hypothetical protein
MARNRTARNKSARKNSQKQNTFFYQLAILGEEKKENNILQKTFSIQTLNL